MRKFIKITLIALMATFTLALNAAPKIAVTNYPWKRLTLESMLKDLKDSSVENIFLFHGMKLGGSGANAKAEFSHTMSKQALAEMQDMLAKENKKAIGIGHIKYTEREDIEAVFKFCKEAGIEIMTIEAPASALKIYDEMSAKYGVKGGLYNHSGKAPYATPAKALAGIKGLENIKVFGDIGQWGRTNLDIMNCLKEVGIDNFTAISLQDLVKPENIKKGKKKAPDCEEFGKGKLPVKEFVTELNSQGFDGYYLVMFANTTDRSQIEKVLPSVEYIKSIME